MGQRTRPDGRLTISVDRPSILPFACNHRLFQRYSHFLLALQLFVLINTCLLLCYNPRDSLADLCVALLAYIYNHHNKPHTYRVH